MLVPDASRHSAPRGRRIQRWPAVVQALRVAGLFWFYAVTADAAVHPVLATAVTLLLAAPVLACRSWASILSTLRRSGQAVGIGAAVHGAWIALNLAALAAAVTRFHPFRWAVGEYLELAAAVVAASWSREDAFATAAAPQSQAVAAAAARPFGRRRVNVALLVMAVAALAWASDLYDYGTSTPLPSVVEGADMVPQEPRARGLGKRQLFVAVEWAAASDTAAGLVLLCLHGGSEALRRRWRGSVEAALDFPQEAAALDVVGVVAGGALSLLYCIGVRAFRGAALVSPALSTADAAAALLKLGAASGLLFAGPMLVRQAGHVARISGASVADLVVTTAASVTAHALWHVDRERAPGGGYIPDTAPHPLWAPSNLLVILAATLLGACLLRAQAAAAGHHHRDTAAGDGIAAVFAEHHVSVASVLGDRKQRRLALFLAATLLYMCVELLVGLQCNSLGLISDAFHMALDSASISIGLYAAVVAKWPADRAHPFGYGRYEVLSGFVNGVLLAFLGISVFAEALHRLWRPPVVGGQYLLSVSVCGLCVNLIGLFCFSDGHGHGHSHGGHGHSHGHGHGSDSDSSSSDDGDHNMRGVFLHVLADLLGSVSVIASSLVVRYTGFTRADAICSAGVSCLILGAAVALVRDTGAILLLAAPASASTKAAKAAPGAGPGCPALLSRLEMLLEAELGAGRCAVHDLRVWTNAASASAPTVATAQVTAALRGDTEAQLRESVRRCVCLVAGVKERPGGDDTAVLIELATE